LSNHHTNAARVAVIGGTGFEDAIDGLIDTIAVGTPHGEIDVSIVETKSGAIVFLPRHGPMHSVPPHKINVHGQIWALKDLGVQHILATSAVGSLRKDIEPGSLVILDDLIDFRGITTTFYDGQNGVVRHVDFSTPFSSVAREALIEAATSMNRKETQTFPVYHTGTYVCVSGPRYETPAEVRLFGSWGADVVGMTVAPEAILARELGLSYAAVSVVTNLGTGLSDKLLDHAEVNEQMHVNHAFLSELIISTAQKLLISSTLIVD
jgi:5'-methylthioadenosine phosphorylase